MGMQGSGTQAPRERTTALISAAKGRGLNSALGLAVLGLMPALAACSSFSSSSTPTASAPATYQPASATATTGATSASDATASVGPYPSQSLMEVFTADSRPAATATTSSTPPASSAAYVPPRPGMPHPPSTYTASAPPYRGSQPGYDAYAGSATAPAKPAPVAAQDDSETEIPGYASKSLLNVFSK
jgi:hypothetical protein